MAVSQDIPTHRYNLNFIYELPVGRGRTFLSGASRLTNLIVDGWEVSGIYSYFSGQFLTPQWTGRNPTNSRTPANVTIRPDLLRNANLPSDRRGVNQWFDPSAFDAPDVGNFGTSAKGVIKGPDVNVWHTGFHKNFIFTEKMRRRLEMTATNFFNHPNWSNPAVNISQVANVGVISCVGGVNGSSTGDQPGARSFRLGVRFEW